MEGMRLWKRNLSNRMEIIKL